MVAWSRRGSCFATSKPGDDGLGPHPLQRQAPSEASKPKARPVFVAALHLKTGELLIVVTNDAPEEALAIYAQRWQIETLFAALKTRGFNLEDHLLT